MYIISNIQILKSGKYRSVHPYLHFNSTRYTQLILQKWFDFLLEETRTPLLLLLNLITYLPSYAVPI